MTAINKFPENGRAEAAPKLVQKDKEPDATEEWENRADSRANKKDREKDKAQKPDNAANEKGGKA